MRLAPGDPVDLFLGGAAGGEGISTDRQADMGKTRRDLRHQLGLDRPLHIQYLHWIELNPDDFRPYFNLGNLYWQQEKYTAAQWAYEQALQLEPDDGDVSYNLAMVHLATEDMDGALPLLEQLAERMPDNASVWMHLGTVYAHKELLEKSEAAFARAEELEE